MLLVQDIGEHLTTLCVGSWIYQQEEKDKRREGGSVVLDGASRGKTKDMKAYGQL